MPNYGVYKLMKYATAKTKEVLSNALESPDYCATLKKDGASYIWSKDLDGSVHLYKDSISKKTGELIDKIENFPWQKKYAEDNFAIGTQILVEICYYHNFATGEDFQHSDSKLVNQLTLCLPPKAIQRQEDKGIAEFYVFDMLFWGGDEIHKMPFQKRWRMVEENIVRTFTPLWMTFAWPQYENKGELVSGWLADGEEGAVLKKLSEPFHLREIGQTEARPMHVTYKVKQVDSLDVVVMDVIMPTSEYTGKNPETHEYKDEDGNPVNRLWALGYANSFRIGAYDNKGALIPIGTVASGLDDEIRKAAAENPESFIGAVVEITCMSKDKDKLTLRHPRLTKIRYDKEAQDCLIKEIF